MIGSSAERVGSDVVIARRTDTQRLGPGTYTLAVQAVGGALSTYTITVRGAVAEAACKGLGRSDSRQRTGRPGSVRSPIACEEGGLVRSCGLDGQWERGKEQWLGLASLASGTLEPSRTSELR